ncbi:hemolysin family protein [Treponema brennaborense]|uniref:CBS domain containing protein n=1 Tax=Treponema brennaborense (strain DSM 12168 / CIP 105900 / DD5/3) TaxID=906968 RepID=F4LKJ4_TREBD|nr:hemolysin family protein [Treponema brennaborense]AEE17550.1 protein of unknown function DUF21 [Treponema brennaborense DSM 12168]
MSIVLTALLLVLLVCASAFFSSSETAFLSLSRITVRQLVKDNVPGSRRIAALKGDIDRVLTTILIGNNFVNNLASSAATALAVSLFGQRGVGAATLAMTVIIIIFGEILPKTIASYKNVVTAQRAALPLTVLQKMMFPLVWAFSMLTKGVGLFVDTLWKSDTPLVTEDELKTLIAVGNAEGTLEKTEKDMLYKIFEFTDLRTRDITRHRSLVKAVSADASYTEAAAVFCSTGYSRLPVYAGNEDEYVGLLHYKDLLFYYETQPAARRLDAAQAGFVRSCMKPVLFVPETKSAVSLLHVFKTERVNFAVVVDEHGTNSGIVTMDDILNAVMGRITDEYASRETPPEERIKILSGTDFLLPGDLRLSDLNGIFSLRCTSDDFDTLGGWLLEQFGYLPSIGEVFKSGKYVFVIEDQAQRRIQSVRLKIAP